MRISRRSNKNQNQKGFLDHKQRVSYNIIMINTAYKHEELLISEIKDKIYKTIKPGLNINIFRLYVLQYLMLLEDQLSPNRNKYLSK